MTKSQKPKSTQWSVLFDEDKLEFVKTSVSWISGKDIMDSCFVLNFGYKVPLPWPQVNVSLSLCLSNSLLTSFNKKVWMRLDDDDTGKGLQLVPESHGMDVPSACTIVIIAGKLSQFKLPQ